jgi:hypothetical protein
VSYTPFTRGISIPKIEKSPEKSYIIILIISVICGVVGLIVVALLI